jgi:siroheme synthase (precorrin-2 oxidase/ferrochelatase)
MSPRPVLPVSLHLGGRVVVLVGDGPLADERADRLAPTGAEVRRIATAAYTEAACDGAALVLGMTDDRALDRRVAQDARARGALGYAHDQPDASDLAMPALARRGPLALAISTDGTAPALARRLREELDRLLAAAGPALDALLAAMARARATLPKEGRADALARIARRLRLAGVIAVDD